MSYPKTEPVTITLTGESFNGTISGYVTHNVQPSPSFRAHVDILKVGDTVEMLVNGYHAWGNRELSRGDVGTVTRMNMDHAIVKFWRYPELELDMPINCLRYVEP